LSGLRVWFGELGLRRALACLGAIAVVVVLGATVAQHRPPGLDASILLWLGQTIPAPLGRLLVLIYQVSGTRFTAVLVVAALIFLCLKRTWNSLLSLSVGTAGILLIVDRWLKPFFERSRPSDRLVEVIGRSFPSGHAAGGVVFYFLMCGILSELYPRLRRALYLGSALWVGLIWLSTLYCRVHWPSDIVAGAAVGFVWLSVCETSRRFSATRISRRNGDDRQTAGIRNEPL
jgi:undecaprenyl-diphosphatase